MREMEASIAEGRPRVPRWVWMVAALLAIAALWLFTPLPEFMKAERLAAVGQSLRASPFAPLIVVAGFLGGALVLLPVTPFIVATAIVFDPSHAFAYAFVGTLASAAMTYGLGRLVGGGGQARWLARPKIARLRKRLERRGILAMAVVRIVPVGNFTLINMVAGAIPIPFHDYILGNVLGLLPPVLATTLLAGLFAR